MRFAPEISGPLTVVRSSYPSAGLEKMSSISAYIQNEPFSSSDIKTMSAALDDVCEALKINGDAVAREVIAVRIVELARRGERDRRKLTERLVAEANGSGLK